MREWLKAYLERLMCLLKNGKHHKVFNRHTLRLECKFCCWHSRGFIHLERTR